MAFLPISLEEAKANGITEFDFVIVTGDAYVDHPSFGTAVIGRVLEAEGYSVAVIPQPDWRNTDDFKRFGKPRLAFLVNSGNIDSMVAHYTAARRRRNSDYYSPGGVAGKRPDRAVIVYCNRIREAYGDVPVIIGGVEASTRRFAHYDYWTDSVRRSILVDSRADILTYGMGENILRRIAFLLDKGVPVKKIRDVRGCCYLAEKGFTPKFETEFIGDYDTLKTDKAFFAKAFEIQARNQDHVVGKALIEDYGEKILVQTPPMPPLTRSELDAVYSLSFEREVHPSYLPLGGVPAINEVKFSIAHNRGCFGSCNFCSIAFHQGRQVVSRSVESVVREAEILAQKPDFKGYIHDIGGPTANFRFASCEKQKKHGMCVNRKCLEPSPCPNLKVDHSDYIHLLEQVEKVKGVKKVFIRSGIRFDYVVADKNDAFFKKLVRDHVSGQLKVAPEHCVDGVLHCMGKPSVATYNKFKDKFYKITASMGKEQYLVPYLMSSHPGSKLEDALQLALYLKENNINPEQVQDFYPTPGTASTCMFHTGLDPFTGEPVYVARSYEEKQLQRALLQAYRPENSQMVKKALYKLGREDLIPVLLPFRKKIEKTSKTSKMQGKNHQKPKNNDKRRRK